MQDKVQFGDQLVSPEEKTRRVGGVFSSVARRYDVMNDLMSGGMHRLPRAPDLVVMGTKGASGLKRILIGSNTVHIISSTRMPVLVIPEVARFENFLNTEKNRIVLATDLDELENEDAIKILKEIALLMSNPKVRVLSVRPQKTSLPDAKRMYRDFLLSFFEPEIKGERATVFSGNVVQGINFYLNEHSDTGLLAMIARNSGHLIQKHFTREMASHTHLPLLILHENEL